jgi:hypothetical protein
MTDIVPAGGTAVAPAGGGGALVPATSPNLPTHLNGGGGRPSAGNAVSREDRRRGGGAVQMNLADYSNLDEILFHLTQLNTEIGHLLDKLVPLKKGSEALEAIIANVDELSKHYEAPATTRSATDADSTICMIIDDMVADSQRHGFNALKLNAAAFAALQAVAAIQESLRAQGAGPRLLATAGRA